MALTRGFIRNAPTTPLDARLMDAGRLVGNADGSPRAGVLDGDGRALVTALGTMTVAVAAADFVTTKGTADGAAVFTNDGVVNVPITAAPASNSRIDVIYVKHNDNTTGDANALPVFAVAVGTAAATPTKPSIPAGALELATLRVYAGTTAANGGSNVLTNTYAMTAARGGVVPFRTKTELDGWATSLVGQLARTLDDGRLYERTSGGAWAAVLRGQITPGSVTGNGVTIDADGTVILSAVPAGTSLQIRDIFSPKFRHYQLRATFQSKVSGNGYSVAGLVGSSTVGGTSYSRSYQAFFGGVGRQDVFATGLVNFAEAFIPTLGTAGSGVADVLSPNAPEPTYITAQTAHVGGITGVMNFSSALNTNDQLTGLQITCAPGGTTTGEIRIYGVE